MKLLVIAMAVMMTVSAQASRYKGSVNFSSEEVAKHEKKINQLLEVSKNCLQNYKASHINFYRNNCRTKRDGTKVCLSKYYGERKYSKKRGARRADGQRLEYLGDALKNSGFSLDYMRTMETTSCVGMALSCLKQGFERTGQSAQWKKVISFVRKNNVGGTSLQHALQKLGWRLFYWNPVPLNKIEREAKKWDIEEKNWKSKGWHHYRYVTVMNHNRYWYNTIDDKFSMVGFGEGTPNVIRNVPFWVGIAHTGYHVFPGTYADVIEAHSTRHITSYTNMEFSKFAPFAQGGGPRWSSTEKYRSGMIALPPGY